MASPERRLTAPRAPMLMVMMGVSGCRSAISDVYKRQHEENPALGYRAIRICLTRRDFFKTQLRALLRASAYGLSLIHI